MKPLSRRTVLRGLGAAVALPLLDAMIPLRGAATAATPAVARRFVGFQMPNGRSLAHWRPTLVGDTYDLPHSLEPLAPVQERVRVLSKLIGYPVFGGNHATAARSVLSEYTDFESLAPWGRSVDTLLADHLGAGSAIPHLSIASEPAVRCREVDCLWSAHVSWRDAETPVPRDLDPHAVFERLFGRADADAVPSALRRAAGGSILDAVLADAHALQSRLGSTDRARVQGWLDGIREVERRLEIPPTACGGTPPGPLGAEHAEHVDRMLDLVVLALACDRTRVVTYMPANEQSERSLRFLGHEIGHHGASHEDPVAHAAAVRWYVGRYAHLVQRLASTIEADGASLLDRSFVLFFSGMGDGERHVPRDLPVLLAGDGGGRAAPRGHLSFPDEPAIARLHLSILQACGVDVSSFGLLATEPLLDLT